ncbi:MAG: sulfotransferase domain-containing protein [Candidatus Tectomicrobia bacterium]
MWKRWFRRRYTPFRYITVVSGLPRSGTSMMMQMLAAGGMDVVVDNIRQADEDNPKGYYELENVKKLKDDPSFLDDALGKACKIISMLLYDLPQDKPYKIIFMRRNLKELLASQKIMLQRREKDVREDDNTEMERIFTKHLNDITAWLDSQDNIDIVYVNYREVMDNPFSCAQAVNQFLDHRLNVQDMIHVVDHALYRTRDSHT